MRMSTHNRRGDGCHSAQMRVDGASCEISFPGGASVQRHDLKASPVDIYDGLLAPSTQLLNELLADSDDDDGDDGMEPRRHHASIAIPLLDWLGAVSTGAVQYVERDTLSHSRSYRRATTLLRALMPSTFGAPPPPRRRQCRLLEPGKSTPLSATLPPFRPSLASESESIAHISFSGFITPSLFEQCVRHQRYATSNVPLRVAKSPHTDRSRSRVYAAQSSPGPTSDQVCCHSRDGIS